MTNTEWETEVKVTAAAGTHTVIINQTSVADPTVRRMRVMVIPPPGWGPTDEGEWRYATAEGAGR